MDRLQLYRGDSLKLLENLSIKHPTLAEVVDLGFGKYENYISILSMTTNSVADILWFDMNIWFEDISTWDLILSIWMNNNELQNALKWFTGHTFNVVESKGVMYLCNEEQNVFIHKENFFTIVDFLKDINMIQKEWDKIDKETEKYDLLSVAGNRQTKIIIMSNMNRKRKNPKKEEKRIDLASIVSSIDWKGCRGNEIWQYPIYRIYEGYMRLNTIDSYDKTLLGYYSGNIDTTKTKIDFDKINWSNIIKN